MKSYLKGTRVGAYGSVLEDVEGIELLADYVCNMQHTGLFHLHNFSSAFTRKILLGVARLLNYKMLYALYTSTTIETNVNN